MTNSTVKTRRRAESPNVDSRTGPSGFRALLAVLGHAGKPQPNRRPKAMARRSHGLSAEGLRNSTAARFVTSDNVG